MKCKKCGSEIPEDSRFCPYCGQASTEDSVECGTKKRIHNMSLKGILILIAAGIWMLVMQNMGIIPVSQNVHVKNTVDVTGNVGVSNLIDVNLQEINGRSDVFFNNPKRGDQDKYYVLPVTVE